MPRESRAITPEDILPMQAYAAIRGDKRAENIVRKQHRRLTVGPHVTVLFENWDTMWLQVHEMLRAEKGGTEQIPDELAAYNPMIPNGSELTCTLMFEIDEPGLRARVLGQLGGLEDHIYLSIDGGESARRGRRRCRADQRGRQDVIGSLPPFPLHAEPDHRVPPARQRRDVPHRASELRPYRDPQRRHACGAGVGFRLEPAKRISAGQGLRSPQRAQRHRKAS